MSQKTLERLEHLRKLNSNRQWVNHEIYRLMYKEDLYIVAYERIKSKPGNMTPGTDEETLDGFSREVMREIIQEMKTEQFRFKPVRQQFIPKPNGKMRKLGIPCVRDKIVQEVMRMILEAIYDSPNNPYFPTPATGSDPITVVTQLYKKFEESGLQRIGGSRAISERALTNSTIISWLRSCKRKSKINVSLT